MQEGADAEDAVVVFGDQDRAARTKDRVRRLILHPEDTILRPGGAILVAEDDHGVLGVCALLHHAPGCYEVSKMAVRKDLRGRGIGRQLLVVVISHARKMGAKQLRILSNTVLAPAIHLYRQLGFVEVPIPADQGYERANIALELALGQEADPGRVGRRRKAFAAKRRERS